jgi:hypothetical protein
LLLLVHDVLVVVLVLVLFLLLSLVILLRDRLCGRRR